MPPKEGPMKELDDKFVDLIGKFVSDVKIGKLSGSCNIALSMLSLLEQIINECENPTAFALCGCVRAAGRLAAGALPLSPAAGTVARRVLRAIRDENRATANQSVDASGESLQRLVLAAGARRATLGAGLDLTEPLRDHIAELRLELESSTSVIVSQARAHVHSEELILTCGASPLAERFLKAAAPRNYRLILAESNNVNECHSMANRLSSAGVPVTVISHASVFAVMSRVNKVVVGVSAALSGGAALAEPGTYAVTQAARVHGVPVLCVCPLHNLVPLHDVEHAHTHPAALPYEKHEVGVTHVLSATYDYTPPDHITLFITNLGGSSPSYMYRLMSELYDPNDYTL